MRDEDRGQVAGIAGGVAQDERVADRRAVVAERDAARIDDEEVVLAIAFTEQRLALRNLAHDADGP